MRRRGCRGRHGHQRHRAFHLAAMVALATAAAVTADGGLDGVAQRADHGSAPKLVEALEIRRKLMHTTEELDAVVSV